MRATHKQVIAMFQRVQDFLGANPLPASSGYEAQKQKLDELLARLSVHSTAHVSSIRLNRAETQRLKSLRRDLRDRFLTPISQVARATLSQAPGIEKALKSPSQSWGTLRLIEEAKGIRDAAATYSQIFVEAGQPADFLEQIDAACETLRQSLLVKARKRGSQAGARRGMKDEIALGRKLVSVLDTRVRREFATQGDVLAKWHVTKRIGPVIGGGSPIATVPEPTPSQPTPIAA